MRDLPVHDRPREKIARKGPEALMDHELIAAILGGGIRGHDVTAVSREIAGILNERGLSGVSSRDLLAIPGIGPARAAQLIAAFEISRRHLLPRESPTVIRPEDVLPLVQAYRDRKQEYFIAITLNGAGEVIRTRVVTVGLLNHSLVHPREVFADAISDRAASMICVHNHPSGSLTPSNEDLAITRQLADAGAILGIRLLDHIIVTKTGHASLREQGHL